MTSSGDDFEGKVAIVTGGASGIGDATVRRLLGRGARVAIFDREPAVTDSDDCMSEAVDVRDQAAITAATERVVERWGRLDVLVNSAGIGAAGTVLDNDEEEWQRVFDINMMGTVRTIRAALPHLIASRPSSVVNVASAVALTGFANRALYTASKGSIVALTRAMAADHLKDGVRFNAVCPGTTETPWIQRLLSDAGDAERERHRLEARQPHGRLVSADEVADAILYLANPVAQSTNGVVLSVDAGIQALYVRN